MGQTHTAAWGEGWSHGKHDTLSRSSTISRLFCVLVARCQRWNIQASTLQMCAAATTMVWIHWRTNARCKFFPNARAVATSSTDQGTLQTTLVLSPPALSVRWPLRGVLETATGMVLRHWPTQTIQVDVVNHESWCEHVAFCISRH